MTLTGSQIAQLLDALLDAYPRHDALRMMVRVEMNENLDAIAGGGNLRGVAFSLIEWAISTGRIQELIAGARRATPGNARLQAFARSLSGLDGETGPPAPPSTASPSPSVRALILREKEASLSLLATQYTAASQQLRTELNAANRPPLQQRLRQLEEEMVALQAEIDRLQQASGAGAQASSAPLNALTAPSSPVALHVTIRPRMEQVYTALSDLFDRDERPLVEVALTNNATQERRLLVSSHIQEYSHVAETSVVVAAGATATVRHLPALRKPTVQGLTELTKAELSVAVRDLATDKVETQQSFRIVLLARSAAPIAARDPSTDTWLDLTRYLGAFVTPNAPAVQETLRRAAERHPEKRLAGYQADVLLQVNALYDVLAKEIGVVYINSQVSFNPDATALDQRVRLPRETLQMRSANCIDGVLLFASLLEACTLNPALLIGRDHALVGWEQRPGRTAWTFLETTMLSTNSFAEALDIGKRRAATFQERAASTGDANWFRLWPLQVLRRQQHITPLE